MNLNKVVLIGRLTRDPESRTTPGGQNVTRFGLATGRTWTNSSGEKQEKTDFHNVVTWGKLANLCQQYLIKGQEVYVEGRIENRSWQDQQGNKRNQTDIIAQTVQFGAKPRGGAPAAPKPEETESDVEAPSSEEEIDVEEIPF